jgi:hypothetical protein
MTEPFETATKPSHPSCLYMPVQICGAHYPIFHMRNVSVPMALTQAIPMADGSTLALKPGVLFQVHDDGTVSVVNPSSGTLDVVGNLPKSSVLPPLETSKVCISTATIWTTCN